MTRYLLYLVQTNYSFRKAELESLCDLYNVKISNLDDIDKDLTDPFVIIEAEENGLTDEIVKKLMQRSILCKGIYELYDYVDNNPQYDDLHLLLQKNSILHNQIIANNNSETGLPTFKFDIELYGGTKKHSSSQKLQIINSFQYLDIQNKINLKNPDITYTIIEHYLPKDLRSSQPFPNKIYFTRLVSLSKRSGENILDKYDLSKRPFRGTTSFEAELSLVTCNIAQIDHNKILYDPFVGTGSFLVTGAEFGGLCLGSDIDGRMIRGHTLRTPSNSVNATGSTSVPDDISKYQKNGIQNNFNYYGYPHQLLDVLTMDFTHNSLRSSLKIDTIICDPPYGIREGIKVLGAKDPKRQEHVETFLKDGKLAYLHKDYIPTKKPYSLDLLLNDLLQFAAERLPIGGRLCFWMPLANSDDVETLVPLHTNLELKYNCVQNFNKWSRRLLCYTNRGDTFHGPSNIVGGNRAQFREDYFKGFNK